MAGLGFWELQTSTIQAQQLSRYAQSIRFWVEPGANPSIRFPGPGPFDQRTGYSRLPAFLKRLEAEGFAVERQARASPTLTALMDLGLFPIYREKSQTGLKVLDCRGRPLYAFDFPQRVYRDFAEVPPLVVNALLFIENRELLDSRYPYRNPAVEWDRLANAVLNRMVRLVAEDHPSPGGSTLATQMEKYRHSPGGRTDSAEEKVRQMVSASLRAYLHGNETLTARRQIVVDYLNTVPLAAVPGFGEVVGLGDGLKAWYGEDFDAVNARLHRVPRGPEELEVQARAFRQVLSLLIAQRRPSELLNGGRERLDSLTDSYLRLLAKEGVVDGALARTALRIRVVPRASAPLASPGSFAERKGADAARVKTARLLGVASLYELDRLDLTVETPLEGSLQKEVSEALRRLTDPRYAREAGLLEPRLLARGDPSQVIYSFTLMERAADANRVRVQADSIDQPFDMNEGAKLDLGSTAKLRTLVTYLELIAELHARYGALPPEALRKVEASPRDLLTRWALDYLGRAQDRSLSAMLEAALDRRYSASPHETFFTGGGLHSFENFRPEDDFRVVSVGEAFRDSINLPFVRLMRDIVHHVMFREPGSTARLLQDPTHPLRAEYLSRFADREGRAFVRRFYTKYKGKSQEEMLALLAQGVRPTPARLAVAFRAVAPEAGPEALEAFLAGNLPPGQAYDATALYLAYAPDRYDLVDQGFLAGVHPLELWVVEFLSRRPGASLAEAVEASQQARQAVYRWLFRTRNKNAQDQRIWSLMEVEAFMEIHERWRRLGYPFDTLVPSYATALGSSADRPAALAELMGILVNDGVRLPTVRLEAFHFARATPFETRSALQAPAGERVLPAEVAAAVRRALEDVVARGTGRRLPAALTLADGSVAALGGKTGTGDHRFEVYAAGGRLVESRVMGRAATFVFLIGDRYFGTVTAYVPGEKAKDYRFTSALPVQVLKSLLPVLEQHLGATCPAASVRLLADTSAAALTPPGSGRNR
jgi:membrane peptidoglycan carboxypeptidase